MLLCPGGGDAFQVSQQQHTSFLQPRVYPLGQRQLQKYFLSAAADDHSNDTSQQQQQRQYTVQISSNQLISRPDAVHLLDTYILPTSEKGYRMNLNSNDVLDNSIDNDSSTYGELSLTSLEIVLDRIAQEILPVHHQWSNTATDERQQRRPLKMIDIGSGCGRLVLYMAISQQWLQEYYNDIVVIGIEQSPALYEESIRATERLLLQYNSNINNKQRRRQYTSTGPSKFVGNPTDALCAEGFRSLLLRFKLSPWASYFMSWWRFVALLLVVLCIPWAYTIDSQHQDITPTTVCWRHSHTLCDNSHGLNDTSERKMTFPDF